MAFPGGCILGKRSIRAHINAFRDFGAELEETQDVIHLSLKNPKSTKITMWEISVTATENILMAAAAVDQKNLISLSAAEPHVQNLCLMLKKMGAKISGVGTSKLLVEGTSKLKGATHTIVGDYLEMGLFAIAAATVPKSKIEISGLKTEQLDSFWNKFREAGVKFELEENKATVYYTPNLKSFSKLDTRIYPGFPTDLQAPFSIILTQSKGVNRIFETLFESRLNYLFELEKMGAKIEVYNPHQALVVGKTKLTGANVESCDLRAGATLILAGLIAKGTTNVFNIDYIDRGYENIEGKFKSLGAHIERKMI
jgi:UDP-N-acetylglucosamine 1-carboxyvinyltransferase